MAVSRLAAVLPEAFDLFWLNFHKLARHMCSNSGVAALEDIISYIISIKSLRETTLTPSLYLRPIVSKEKCLWMKIKN